MMGKKSNAPLNLPYVFGRQYSINMADGQPQEIIAIRYRDITWTHVQAGARSYSTWEVQL